MTNGDGYYFMADSFAKMEDVAQDMFQKIVTDDFCRAGSAGPKL